MSNAPVSPLLEVKARVEAIRGAIQDLGVYRLALFGSVVHGTARADIDVDVLVQFLPGAKTFERFLDPSKLLESTLGQRIELVTTEALSHYMEPRTLAEAQEVLRAA